GKGQCLQYVMLGKLDIHTQKNGARGLLHSIYGSPLKKFKDNSIKTNEMVKGPEEIPLKRMHENNQKCTSKNVQCKTE
ncbi:hypothetical protein ACQP3C_27825, partial [Escherichia coli]